MTFVVTSNALVNPYSSTVPLVVSVSAAYLLGNGTKSTHLNPEKVLMTGHCCRMVTYRL